ncbi:hypothetical protein LXL04_010450 [Taraxacum kok-saghyz]
MLSNAQFPLLASDIIFGPEDENFRPYHVVNNLSDWNCEDPTRLLSLILEHRIYTWHIRENVLGRLKFEIHTIYS